MLAAEFPVIEQLGAMTRGSLAGHAQRTAQEVVAALLREPGSPQESPRPAPMAQERRATLEGKAVAMRQLVARVTRRQGPQIQHRIALTDGAEALPQQVVTHLPAYTLILEIVHATEWYQIPSPVHAGVLPMVRAEKDVHDR